MENQLGQLLSVSAAAKLMGFSRQHLYNLHKAGKLPFVDFCGVRRVREADLLSLIKPEAPNEKGGVKRD